MKSPQTGLAEAGRLPSWLLPLAVLFFDVAIVLFALPHEPARDEAVFFPAARAFAAAGVFPSLELLRHYPAPQAPLSLYLGGRLLAIMPSLRLLRLVDCLLMSGALLCFSRFAARHCGKNAALASALIALNPYFHLVATHFYSARERRQLTSSNMQHLARPARSSSSSLQRRAQRLCRHLAVHPPSDFDGREVRAVRRPARRLAAAVMNRSRAQLQPMRCEPSARSSM